MSYNDYLELCLEFNKQPQSSNSHWIVQAEALYTAKVLLKTKLEQTK